MITSTASPGRAAAPATQSSAAATDSEAIVRRTESEASDDGIGVILLVGSRDRRPGRTLGRLFPAMRMSRISAPRPESVVAAPITQWHKIENQRRYSAETAANPCPTTAALEPTRDEPAPDRDISRGLPARHGQCRRPVAQRFAALGDEGAAPRRTLDRADLVRAVERTADPDAGRAHPVRRSIRHSGPGAVAAPGVPEPAPRARRSAPHFGASVVGARRDPGGSRPVSG